MIRLLCLHHLPKQVLLWRRMACVGGSSGLRNGCPDSLQNDVMFILLLKLSLFLPATSSVHLTCHHCISQVPLGLVQQDAKDAFKTLMFTKFNVPPSHPFCHDAEAFEFSSVRGEQCPVSDHCVKTTIQEIGFAFVMRGCVSSLYRPGYQLSTNVSCTQPAPTCLCDSPLCNTSRIHTASILLVLSFIYSII